jgi:FAD/FMN-containing dehydrogenase
VILADGHEYRLGPLTMSELRAKMSQSDFEGSLYQQLFRLLEQNYAAIQRARPRVSKNSTGYALWDVWDRQSTIFDLTKLFVGSQGTLGIITEITFSLVRPPHHSQMLVIFLSSPQPLAALIPRLLRYTPETLEAYDDHTLKLALRFLPQLATKLRPQGLLALLASFWPEFSMMLRGGLPSLVLLAEFSGDGVQEVNVRARAAQAAVADLPVRTRLTRSPEEVHKYHMIRRESFNLLRQHTNHKRTVPFIDDVVVRPERLPEFLPKLEDIMDDYDITYTIAGHAGDGNFHIIPLMDPTRPDFLKIVESLAERVYDLVRQFDGSLSGEHNDGLIRSHYVERMYGHEMYTLFEDVKHLFDPKGIFNPGKKVGSDWNWARQHIRSGPTTRAGG